MKFLCDQCKAKYQIADEKVQGKTLRMKCRKCGHVIEIRATTEAAQTGETMQVASLSDEAAQAALRPSVPAPAPAAPRPGAAAPRPAAGGAPRPAAGGAPRPGATSGGAKPGVPKPEPKAPAGGALASAFNKQVSGHAIADAPVSTTPTGPDVPAEEWYVAIDDVPVGPIRLTELRAKYAQGAVTDDSLVWREGYEEWRPLRTLHELHTVVREEVSGAQVPPRGSSLLPNGSSSAARNAPRTSAPTSGSARPSTRPAAPVTTPRGGGAGNVIPFVQARGAVAARKLDEEQMDDEATQMFAAPMVPPPKPAEPAPISGSLAKNKDDPFGFGVLPEAPAAAAPAAAPTPPPAPVVAAAPVAEEPAHRKGGLSSGTVALIAAACILLGVVVAVFAVKPKVVERVVEKQVNVPVSVYVPVASDSTPAPTVAAPEPSATTTAKVAAKSTGAAAATAAAPTTTATNKKLGSLDGPEGPSVGGTGGGGGGGGGALEGKAVEGVIATKRVGVRKVCFEPWADKGGASVKITLKIGPDGRVQSSDIANTSGEPAIGQCVQRLSKGWTFPASESGGTFNVPFLFGT